MDMLRFQKFTAGRTWVDDYGSSDNPEQFKALFRFQGKGVDRTPDKDW